MAFPRKYLNEGEDIVLELRPHWFFLAGPAVALVVALVLAVVVSSQVAGDVQRLALIPLLLLVLVGLVWFVVRYAKWATTTFVVTTDRLIHRAGVFAKSGREIPLERLNDVAFHQTIIQRVLGAGDLL
ncbi:MAG TPA: PH domain-containing protein, partial [Acidimicrobiales bacterium]|nr:PH domain-containing protein [Acidimicrobiales bacterium]